MKLTRNKISKLHNVKNQSRRKYRKNKHKNKKHHSKRNQTFRKKKSFNLRTKTLKNRKHKGDKRRRRHGGASTNKIIDSNIMKGGSVTKAELKPKESVVKLTGPFNKKNSNLIYKGEEGKIISMNNNHVTVQLNNNSKYPNNVVKGLDYSQVTLVSESQTKTSSRSEMKENKPMQSTANNQLLDAEDKRDTIGASSQNNSSIVVSNSNISGTAPGAPEAPNAPGAPGAPGAHEAPGDMKNQLDGIKQLMKEQHKESQGKSFGVSSQGDTGNFATMFGTNEDPKYNVITFKLRVPKDTQATQVGNVYQPTVQVIDDLLESIGEIEKTNQEDNTNKSILEYFKKMKEDTKKIKNILDQSVGKGEGEGEGKDTGQGPDKDVSDEKSAAEKAKKAAAKKKAEEEAAAKKAQEEAAAKKKAQEEAAAKKKAQEEAAAKKKAEEEAAAKKAEEEAAAKKKAEEEEAASAKNAEEAAKLEKQRKAEEEAASAKNAEEAAKLEKQRKLMRRQRERGRLVGREEEKKKRRKSLKNKKIKK